MHPPTNSLPPLPAEAAERLEWIADTFLSVSTPVQYALPGLLKAGKTIERQIIVRVTENLAWLGANASPLPVEGGWYTILPVDNDDIVIEWLEQHDVLVQPGFFYDFDGDGFIVVSLLTPPEAFQEGMKRCVR